MSRDSSGARAYSLFLVELAEKVPRVMMPNISVLLGLLDGEVRPPQARFSRCVSERLVFDFRRTRCATVC